MEAREPLVPEVLGDLVHPVEAADDEPLEIELVRDAEEERHVECVVVRRERPRRRAAVERLERRRLDLDVAAFVEEPADLGDQPRPLPEDLAHLGVHHEVDVALAVAEFLVGDLVERLAVRLLRERDWPEALRERDEFVSLDRHLAHLRAEHRAAHTDDVADVEQLFDDGVVVPLGLARLLQVVALEVELDLARAVDEVHEHHFAFAPDRAEPAGDGDTHRLGSLALGVVPLVVVGRDDLGGVVGDIPPGSGIRVDAVLAKGGEGLAADVFLFGPFGHGRGASGDRARG